MTNKSHINDKVLVKELKDGNIMAFNQLFYSYSSRLYHFAYGYLKSREEAEELVQDVFTKIWEKRSELKDDSVFKSYVFTIAFNNIKKYFRSKALLNKYFDEQNLSSKNATSINDAEFRIMESLVDQLVETMPPKRKTVFIKSRIEGKNTPEIAAEMGISKSTVENHLNQALNYLRQKLSKEDIAGLLFFLFFIQ